ncbi:MAG TPA: endo-1,4-beta-xylanase [Steroidobacteraceae bacterium]|nr:endo-1,4-beta-xylanase [Steroidobacteraceae bacterium]
MGISRSALLRACLLASVPIAAFSQAPVVVEAESGTLGSSLTTGSDATAGVNYITVLPAANSGANPTPDRVATYTVTFPAPGNYALYMRFLAGPVGGNDDSFYVPTGFNTTTSWAGPYNTSSGGATAPTAVVPVGGNAGQNVWKWQRMTPQVGGGGGTGPSVYVVPEGQLTQTFAWGSREDGLLFDKFAFGPVDVCYTVGDLDAGRASTGTCPPLPPPTPPAYTRTGQPLATGKDKFLGSAHSAGTASLNFGAYWNQVTPENGGKWGSAEPTRDAFNWTAAHQAEAQARAIPGAPFKWHVLFWGNQQPNWMYDLSSAEQLEEIHEWLAGIASEFPNIDQIDVVNEPLHDPPDRTSTGNTTNQGGSGGYVDALGGKGVTGWDWIINGFTLARQYFPNSKLILNDYSITNSDDSTTRYLEIVKLLQDRGLIDGIGIQAHAFEYNYNDLPNSAETHRRNLARLAATGLPVYVTEFDVDGVDPVFGVQDDAAQLQRYQALFPVFWESPAVKGITMWGYVQNSHWRSNQGAWLMYTNGAERPALQWLVKYVENNPPVVNAGQSFTLAENSAAGTSVGTALATDNDAGQTLSQWQINDASGKFAIDPASGAITVAAGASLDFEARTSYSVDVSVYDGYTRSQPQAVTINVTNANDNAPVITAGQSYRIDGGSDNRVAKVLATDADDTNQPGFTTFSGWAISSGNTNNVFRINSAGTLEVARPLLIDWRKSSYSLGSRVSDGANNSAVQAVQVTIPNRVNLCLLNAIRLEAPKAAAPVLILLGSELGSCSR